MTKKKTVKKQFTDLRIEKNDDGTYFIAAKIGGKHFSDRTTLKNLKSYIKNNSNADSINYQIRVAAVKKIEEVQDAHSTD